MRSLVLALMLVSACGTVDSQGGTGGAGDMAGAAGGSASATGGSASAAGNGGEATGGASGGASATGGHDAAGGRDGSGGAMATGGDGGAALCVSNNERGFAFNNTCDGGSPASMGCHANCELNGAHYVGCVAPSTAGPLAYYCYASCSACP